MARWDSPLFTIPWTDEPESLPLESIWKAITQGDVKPPNAGTVGVSNKHDVRMVWFCS
jgi:protein KTI12